MILPPDIDCLVEAVGTFCSDDAPEKHQVDNTDAVKRDARVREVFN
jgi:hypothetical protein